MIYGDITDEESSAPIQKEGTGLKVLPMMKRSAAPNPKEVAGLQENDGVVVVVWRR